MRKTALWLAWVGLLLATSADAQQKQVDVVIASMQGTTNAIYDGFIVIITFVGVGFVVKGLRGLYAASAEHHGQGQNASWLSAFVAILVGGALTTLAIWGAIAANTVSG
jgi:hypothetical protein